MIYEWPVIADSRYPAVRFDPFGPFRLGRGEVFSVFALFFFLPLSTNHASHAEMFYHHYPNHVCWFGACPLQLQQTIRSHSPLNCSFLLVLALFPPGRIPSSTTRGHLCTRLVMFIVRWVRHTGWSKPNQTKKKHAPDKRSYSQPVTDSRDGKQAARTLFYPLSLQAACPPHSCQL